MQIVTINFVSVLSNLGIPLKSIDSMQEKRTPEKILKLLDRHETVLDNEMRRLMDAYAIIHARRNLIKISLDEKKTDPYVCSLPETPFLLGPCNEIADGDGLSDILIKFYKQAKGLRINLSYPLGGYYESIDDFINNPGKPARFFVLDPSGDEVRASGKYLVGHTKGFYMEMGGLPKRMEAYALEHALTFSGPVYFIYLHDEITTSDPNQYFAKVIVGVE